MQRCPPLPVTKWDKLREIVTQVPEEEIENDGSFYMENPLTLELTDDQKVWLFVEYLCLSLCPLPYKTFFCQDAPVVTSVNHFERLDGYLYLSVCLLDKPKVK